MHYSYMLPRIMHDQPCSDTPILNITLTLYHNKVMLRILELRTEDDSYQYLVVIEGQGNVEDRS
jgi:hypothetical protein